MASKAIFYGWPLVPPSKAVAAPAFTVQPSISGTFAVGQQLTGNTGTVTGFPVPTVTRQWLRDGSAISGATGATYTLVDADLGKRIDLAVSAQSIAGSASATAVGSLVQGGGVIPEPLPTRLGIFTAGQSLMAYPASRGTPRVMRVFSELLRTVAGYPATRNVASYSTGLIYHDGANQAADDWTVRVDNCASGGSALLSNSSPVSHVGDAIPPGGYGNYWYNAPGTNQSVTTGNSADDNSAGSGWTPGPLHRWLMQRIADNLALGLPINAFFWSQGTSDMSSDSTYVANYKQQLAQLFADVRSAVGISVLPIFINMLGRHQTSTDIGAEAIRQVQREIIAENSRIYVAGEEYPYRMATVGNSIVSMTSGSNVVTLANTSAWGVNDGVEHASLPSGTYVSAVSANVSLTLSRRSNGSIVAANASETNAAATIYRLDNVHLYPGSDGVQPLDTAGATTHNQNVGFYALFKTAAARIAQVLGFTTAPALGPYVSGATVERGKSVLRVSLSHVAGTDFTVGDNTGWRVLVDGVVRTVSSVAKVNATTVDLTLSSPIGVSVAAVSVQYAYGALNRIDTTQFIFDNMGYPMQARSALAATISASSESLTAGAAATASSATASNTFTFAGLSLGSAPAGRRFILVGITASGNATSRTISSVTVGGVVASVLAGTFKVQSNAAATGASYSAFYLAEVPTGATGDVVVTWNSSMARIGVAVWPIYTEASIPALLDTESLGSTTATDVLSVSLDTYVNGAAFGVSNQQGGTVNRMGSAVLVPTSTQTGLAVSAAPAAGDIVWSGLSESSDVAISTVTGSSSILNTVSLSPF